MSGASFSGKQVLETWPINSHPGLLMSPKRSTVAPPTTVACHRNHHNRRSNIRSSSCRNHSSKASTTVFSCTCFETCSSCEPLKPAKFVGLNETGGDPGRRGHQNYPCRWQRGGVRGGHRTRETVIRSWHFTINDADVHVDGVFGSVRGVGHVKVLVLRDVSMPVGTAVPCVPCLSRKTLPAH